MKLYIENCQLKKDKKLTNELEKDFDNLNKFYFSHCGYSNKEKQNRFYYYQSKKEKEDYLKSYSLFLKNLKEVINESVEDNIFTHISSYNVISNEDSRIYLMDSGHIVYFPKKIYENEVEDITIVKGKNAKLIYPLFLSNDDINYILEKVHFPKNIFESKQPIYWSDRTRKITILDIEKMLKKTSFSKVLHILKCVLKESIFCNLNLKVTKIDKQEVNDLLVSEIYNSIFLDYSKSKKAIYNCIDDYHNFINNGFLNSKLINKVILNIFSKGKNASQEEKDTYKKLCINESNKNNTFALYQLAYGYYIGDELLNYDPFESKKYFDKLKSLGNELANLYLGNLYYYGKLDPDGRPDYKKALDYIRIASDYGFSEALNTLGDMYLNGLGVMKNKNIAYQLYFRCFNNLLKVFLQGNFQTDLPEVCIRLAKFYYECIDEINLDNAFYYIKLAKLSSNCRMAIDNSFENKKINEDIEFLYSKIKNDCKKARILTKYKKINYNSLFYGNNMVYVEEYRYKTNSIIYLTPKYEFFLIDKDYEFNLAYKVKIKYNTLDNNNEKHNSFITDYIDDLKISKNTYTFSMTNSKIKYRNKRIQIYY